MKCKKCDKEFETWPQLRGHYKVHKLTLDTIRSPGARRAWLVKERGHKCECCGMTEWRGQPIPIEVDHIDGHPGHNNKENLRLLCPNCHAQTDSYRGKNVGKHKNTKRQEIVARYPDYRSMK